MPGWLLSRSIRCLQKLGTELPRAASSTVLRAGVLFEACVGWCKANAMGGVYSVSSAGTSWPNCLATAKEQDLVNMFMKDEKRTRVRSGICPWVHQGSVPAPQLDNIVPLDKSSGLPMFLSRDVHSRLAAVRLNSIEEIWRAVF